MEQRVKHPGGRPPEKIIKSVGKPQLIKGKPLEDNFDEDGNLIKTERDRFIENMAELFTEWLIENHERLEP